MSFILDIFLFAFDIFPIRDIFVLYKSAFDPCFIVKRDIPVKCITELLKRGIGIHQRKLCLQMTEERLDPGVVKAVAGTGHTLYNAVFLQKRSIFPIAELCALI